MDLKPSIDVERGSDGRLLAEGWHGYVCDGCDGFHIELFDRQEKTFAALSVDPENLIPLARALMCQAAILAERGLLTIPRLQ